MSKEVTGFRPGSKKWKQFMSKLYGIGGAVVIIGALFKLQHLPGSAAMLWAGLGTEAIIFFFSAFEPLHEDPDWSLVYPELAEDYDGEPIDRSSSGGGVAGVSATQELDLMLSEAKIDSDLIQSLGKGMNNLADAATNMNTMGNASEATNNLISSMNSASDHVSTLAGTYEKAAESLLQLSSNNEDGGNYAENLKKVNENLTSLNNVYELQLEANNDHVRTSAEMFNNIQSLVSNLHDSVEDTKRYKENISELSNNLESLNTVYGNMLNAMNYRPQS